MFITRYTSTRRLTKPSSALTDWPAPSSETATPRKIKSPRSTSSSIAIMMAKIRATRTMVLIEPRALSTLGEGA
jgi:hypothetical protein